MLPPFSALQPPGFRIVSGPTESVAPSGALALQSSIIDASGGFWAVGVSLFFKLARFCCLEALED